MVLLSFLISGIAGLFGLLGITTVYPAIINTIFGWFSK